MSQSVALYAPVFTRRGTTVYEMAAVAPHFEGCNLPSGGHDVAYVMTTGNYAELSRYPSLHGKRAGDTIEELRGLLETLGDAPSDDYWAATPGNVGHFVALLLSWAEQHPDGIWAVHLEGGDADIYDVVGVRPSHRTLRKWHAQCRNLS